MEFIPVLAPIVCSEINSIDKISMNWNGNQSILIKAWNGTIGSTLVADFDNIAMGQKVTVSGYAGSQNDVSWEIFAAWTSTKIGESTFDLSCSDIDMNGPEDCGKLRDNGKTTDTKWINNWIFAGIDRSSGLGFDCP